MRQQGWTVEEVKETVEVPMCGCVRAGIPDEYGDNPHETGSIPMEYVSGKCWLVVVQGESMRDYGLHEGDHLLVRKQDVARSGEIVVAHYDGGPTVKTYFEDEDGSKWLVPGNDKYQAMRIDETHECRIFGVVQTIIHEHPLGDPADCVRYVRKAKEDEGAQLSLQTIARALKETLDHIRVSAIGLPSSPCCATCGSSVPSTSLRTFCPRSWARRLPILTSRTWGGST